MKENLIHARTCVYNINYHVVWSVKHRRKVITEEMERTLRLYGIRLIRQKESYSSQCSPKSEKVDRKFARKEKRRYRGLYVDGNDIYHADCVGAYNILSLYLQKNQLPFPEAIIKLTSQSICVNPKGLAVLGVWTVRYGSTEGATYRCPVIQLLGSSHNMVYCI